MIKKAVYQRAKWCDGSDRGCTLQLSALQPGVTYYAACRASGGSDEDIVPQHDGDAKFTTWVPLPSSKRVAREWLAILGVGVYLLVSSACQPWRLLIGTRKTTPLS